MHETPMKSSVRSVTPAAPVRAPVRNVGAPAALPAAFDVRTAYDFAISLAIVIGEHDELPEEDRRWLEGARSSLPDELRRTIADEIGVHAASLLVDHPEVSDAADLVALLRATPGATFARVVLADCLRDPEREGDVEAGLAGDQAAAERVLACWPEDEHGWLGRLLSDADSVTAQVATVMEAWLPRYQEMEPRIRSIIERDVALRADDRASLGPADLVERTTNGVRWLSEPGVRRVVLAPSYLVRPYNFTFAGGDWRLFVYPVADAALEPHDPLAPPVALLRLHRALGDETRLRILRLLRDRDAYLTEIAERLDLSKPTIKHHLALLRAAGLVTLTEEGGLSYYSLRRERLDDPSSELKHFLT
jgi:DNA-binding transcriptional ArsR family regulator